MKVVITALASLLLFGCSGCSFISKLATPGAQPYVQAAVDIAVAQAVGTDPTVWKEKAGQIKTIATEVLAVDQGSVVPLTQLEAFVNTKIQALKLPPGDVAAAQVLMAALSTAVQLEIQNLNTKGNVTDQTQAAVAQILNDVITATAAYGA